MSDHITLIGAERVSQAASNMMGAATDIYRAASVFEESANRFARLLDEHANRIEAAMAEPAPRRVIVSERVQDPADFRHWITREKGPAMFLRWGSIYEEFDNGVGNQSVGIVQFPDGSIDTVLPHLIRFEVTA